MEKWQDGKVSSRYSAALPDKILYDHCSDLSFFFIGHVQVENIEAPPIGLHYLGALLKEQGVEVEMFTKKGHRP